jgi:ABC-type molybdate transport system ATPase subunit
MFSFANLFSLLEAAPTVVSEGEQIAATAVADAKALLTNPAVLALEAFFASAFTSTTTPGAAVVVEPHSK